MFNVGVVIDDVEVMLPTDNRIFVRLFATEAEMFEYFEKK